jgi:RecG-like helicase
LISNLEYKLTNSQIRCINEIKEDLEKPYPMSRMLQGDVGCGKTIVAVASILFIIKTGGQVALMTPTDVLSQQHFNTISNILKIFNIKLCLLTNRITKNEKTQNISLIKSGKVDLIIGTHSLISENLNFKNLKLVIIDEQHKFGVSQRSKLLSKGKNIDLLLISATPIPRSLYMTVYGDLD